MSVALDTDIYDDLYGEDNLKEGPVSPMLPPKPQVAPPVKTTTLPPTVSKPVISGESTLPAKPTGLSYSAQVAQQFSAYKQTPGQERSERPIVLDSMGSKEATPPATASSSQNDASRTVRPSEMKDEGKMFIGGLNWDTTDEGLNKYFSEFGKVEACTIMRDPDGRSRGFAFLTFEDPSSVNAVMIREHYLDGKAIDPKRAIPRLEHLRSTRYFVGGLSHDTTSDSMRTFFSTYGKVVDATVMVDRETGRSKGFGFVTFEDATSADQLVGRFGLVLDDKQIEVKTAQPRSQRDMARNARSSGEGSISANGASPSIMGYPTPQQPIMSAQIPLVYQRMVGQMPMIGAGMPSLGMNPMSMGMGMGMGGMGMGGMGMGMNNMGMGMGMGMGMPGGGGMIGMGATSPPIGGDFGRIPGTGMRMGMGPMSMVSPMGARAIMTNAGMGMPQGMMMGGMRQFARGRGGPMVNTGVGPTRNMNRGQHGFHPYAR